MARTPRKLSEPIDPNSLVKRHNARVYDDGQWHANLPGSINTGALGGIVPDGEHDEPAGDEDLFTNAYAP